MTDVYDCVIAPFRVAWLLLWPIFSIALGIVTGVILSAAVTMTIFLITVIRTPMHIFKMLHVTVSTEECFPGRCSWIMRSVVFICVPAVHAVFLIGITTFSATIGTLYYVGKSTKVFYKHEYRKSLNKIESNARLEDKSYLGRYIKACKDYMKDDDVSTHTIYCLKGLIATIPGSIISSLIFIPFSLAIVAISLYRLPINVYKTMKIALFTVILKWDLRLVVLALLPLIHTMFPLLAFLGSMVGSFFWTWFRATKNIARGDSPFRKVNKLTQTLERYHESHVEFVSQHCHRFDHPSGIPYGWDGRSYGLEIERVLKWQRDFVICCFLILLETPVCLASTILLSAIKYVPSCFHCWKGYIRDCCNKNDEDCVSILSMWPFHVLGIVFLPVGVLLYQAFLVIFAVLRILFEVPWTHLVKRENFHAAFGKLFEVVYDHDVETGHLCGDVKILCKLEQQTEQRGNREQAERTDIFRENRNDLGSYWDCFVSQSIQNTASLLEDDLVFLEDVQSMEPSAIQAIPAVTILDVLCDSVKDEDLFLGDIKWKVDGTVCKESERPASDGILNQLWPMVLDIKRFLQANKNKALTERNIQTLRAMLCANQTNETKKLKTLLEMSDSTTFKVNQNIRTKINRLVLALLRVKPYQERMENIYTNKYTGLPKIEEGTDASPPHTNVESRTEETGTSLDVAEEEVQ